MLATTTPLLELTARDLMSRDVVVIPLAMPLRAAAGLLSRAQVSGAPVVDAAGHCVGMLSAHDFMRWTEKGKGAARRRWVDAAAFCADWQIPNLANIPEEAVAAFMTADPVTVRPEARIGELARMMLDAHIHRLVVVSEENRPLGIVSSTDILAAVARADTE
jgi:CBS domain-containing protein